MQNQRRYAATRPRRLGPANVEGRDCDDGFPGGAKARWPGRCPKTSHCLIDGNRVETVGTPCFQARNMQRHRPGATFEVTEMQPSPPCARYGNVSASSPQRSRKSVPRRERKRAGRAVSPAASLRPITRGNSARRAIVSSASPHAVRDGTS